MNEKIKQLADEALDIVSNKRTLQDGQLERTWDPDRYNQVFAELVAKECAKVCEDYAAKILKYSQFGSNAAPDCAKMIKEHFGIDK